MSWNPRALVIPDGTEVIKTNQYRKANYEQVFIPKSVTEIKLGAFDSCKNLREVVFEEGSKLRIIGIVYSLAAKVSQRSTSQKDYKLSSKQRLGIATVYGTSNSRTVSRR